MKPFYALLSINREIRQLTVLGFHPNKEQAEAMVLARSLGDPHLVVDMSDDPATTRDRLVKWLLENNIPIKQAHQLVTEFAGSIKRMLQELRGRKWTPSE